MTVRIFGLIFIVFSFSACASNLDRVKEQMIKQSIQQYSGNCPCPYNTTRAGHRCGKRSAYSKPGGEEPLCYKNDIPDGVAKKYLPKKDE